MSTIKKIEENKTVDCLNSLRREETIYEDQDKNSRALSLMVENGKVRMNESDCGPACSMMNGGSSYDRDLFDIDLKELMGILGCGTIDEFYLEMRKRFGFCDGMDRFYEFLQANKLNFNAYAG